MTACTAVAHSAFVDVIGDPAVSWQDILQWSFYQLDLVDVWRISLTSKAANELCLERLSDGKFEHARELLFRAVATDADSQQPWLSPETQLRTAVRWLLGSKILPSDLLALDSSRYLCIPSPSFRQDLLAAGVKVTYGALVTAARHLTGSLHQWIEDCDELQLDLEIDGITRAACCFDVMAMNPDFLNSSLIILDHLYLALSCIGNSSPVVNWNACANIIALCKLPAAEEVSATEIEPFLHAVVQVVGSRGCSTIGQLEADAVDELCRLSATKGLSVGAVYALLKATVQTDPNPEVLPMFRLPAVRQLDPSLRVELMLTYMRAVITARKGRKDFKAFNGILGELATPHIPHALLVSLFQSTFELLAET